MAASRAGPDIGLLQDERIIEQGQCLGRHVGNVPTALGYLAAGEVEGTEELGCLHQVVADVKAASAGAIQWAGKGPAIGVLLVAVRVNARAVQGGVQPAGGQQDGIADCLRLHPTGGKVVQEPVLRIDFPRRRR